MSKRERNALLRDGRSVPWWVIAMVFRYSSGTVSKKNQPKCPKSFVGDVYRTPISGCNSGYIFI